MRSNHKTDQTNAFGKAIAAAFPFDHTWLRYAVCTCLAACTGAAAWALLVIEPATRSQLADAAPLIELEQSYATVQVLPSELEDLRLRANEARQRLFPSAKAVDPTIVEIIDRLEAMGWDAVVSSVERDEQSSARLAFASYQLELKKVAAPASQSVSAPVVTNQLLGFLESIRSAPGVIDIQRFEVVSKEARPVKAFVSLVASVAK